MSPVVTVFTGIQKNSSVSYSIWFSLESLRHVIGSLTTLQYRFQLSLWLRDQSWNLLAWGQFAPVDTFQLSGFHPIPMIIGALNDCVDQQSED